MAVGARSALSRSKLLSAVRAVVAERGLEGVRVRSIAAAAGVSPGSVLYHYPDQAEMMVAVHRDLVEDYCETRERSVAAETDAVAQLLACARAGLPPLVDEKVVGPLFEMHALARRSDAHAELMTGLWDRERTLYQNIIVHGVETNVFTPRRSAEIVAENLLALEDGLGLHLVSHNKGITADIALGMLIDYAASELQCDDLRLRSSLAARRVGPRPC